MTDTLIAIRASSWGDLFDCAYRWEGVHLLGIRSPRSPRALLGTAFHAATAAYDKGRMDGSHPSIEDTAAIAVDAIAHPEYEVDWSLIEQSRADLTATAITLHLKYCQEVSPRYSFRAVELETVPMDIACGNGITVRLTGTLDRSRMWADSRGVGIADIKTGAQAVQKGHAVVTGHGPQLGVYELLYEHSTGEAITAPSEIIGAKTSGKPEIATGLIHNARAIMVGTDNAPGLIEHAAVIFKTGLFPPNTKSHLCSERYCPRWQQCPYPEK